MIEGCQSMAATEAHGLSIRNNSTHQEDKHKENQLGGEDYAGPLHTHKNIRVYHSEKWGRQSFSLFKYSHAAPA